MVPPRGPRNGPPPHPAHAGPAVERTPISPVELTSERLAVRQERRAEAGLLLATFLWGSTFVVVKEALADCSTLLFLALRFTLATAALAVAFRGWRRPAAGSGRAELRAGVITGVALFAGYLLQTWGLLDTTPSKAAFITGLNVVFVPLLLTLLERRLPSPSEAVGVAIAAVGMGLMTLEPGQLTLRWGDFLTLLCAIAFSVHVLLLGRYSPRVDTRNLSLSQIAVAGALAYLCVGWAEPVHFRPTGRLLGALLVTGLLSTALAFSLMTWAQRHTTPTRAALLFALEPVFAWVTSFLVAGELLSRRATLGAALILAGVLLVELKPLARGQHPSTYPTSPADK